MLKKLFKYVNEEEKFWDHSYKVILSQFDPSGIIVNADNEQDALDYAIDFAEEQGWIGLFLDQDEITRLDPNEQENLIFGGNHGLALSWEDGPIIEKLD